MIPNYKRNMAQEDVFKKIVSHCKEYGFVFPSSEIYDGLGAVYDYGQNGVELKNNIKQYWWKAMTMLHENIVGPYGIVASVFSPYLCRRFQTQTIMAKIYVNGDAQEVSLPLNVSELIQQQNVLQPEMVSVQVNEEFAEREDWESIQLKEGDKVDFLYFMGGGAL